MSVTFPCIADESGHGVSETDKHIILILEASHFPHSNPKTSETSCKPAFLGSL